MTNDHIERMKERMLESFLDGLRNIAFIESTDSLSGEKEYFNPEVEDMEAVIKINIECDREDLKDLIVSRAG